MKSSTNLAAPDSTPAFEINSGGVISGSDLYIRQVYEPIGGSATIFKLIDTDQGKIIARNIGRQIISDTTEYERKNVDDGGSFFDVDNWVVTLLPGEDTILIYADVQNFNTVGSGVADGEARFQIARSITGSINGSSATSKYDEWETDINMGTFAPSAGTTAAPYGTISAGPGQNEISYSIATNTQSTQVKITLQLNMNSSAANTGRGIKIKNISAIATSAFGASFATPTLPVIVR